MSEYQRAPNKVFFFCAWNRFWGSYNNSNELRAIWNIFKMENISYFQFRHFPIFYKRCTTLLSFFVHLSLMPFIHSFFKVGKQKRTCWLLHPPRSLLLSLTFSNLYIIKIALTFRNKNTNNNNINDSMHSEWAPIQLKYVYAGISAIIWTRLKFL